MKNTAFDFSKFPLTRSCLVMALLALTTAAHAGQCPVTNALKWSNPATWGGTLPATGANVIVPAGTTIILDTTTAPLGSLNIEGTLQFEDRNVALTAASINVSGALLIGSANAPFRSKATITLTGAKPAAVDPGGASRGLIVSGGRVEMFGVSPSPVWTRINADIAAGAKAVTLQQSTDWSPGNEIVIAPTDYYGVAETEKHVVASNAGAALTTNDAVAKFRWGKLQYVTNTGMSLTPGVFTTPLAPSPTVLDQRAAVGNLTRNIVVQGIDDMVWRNDRFGAHMMIMDLKSKVVIDGVEFRRAGQAGLIGRYPVHWHMLSYNPATGAMLGDATGHVIRNSTVSQSMNRCIVVHGTNGVQVLNNVCHDIRGHAFFLEDGAERRNLFEGNLALKIRAPADADSIQVHEKSGFQGGPAGFWITNPDNIVRNNLAGDAERNGFWFSFPARPVGQSKNVPLRPINMKHGAFHDNVAHSNGGPGVLLDWVPIDDAGNITNAKYVPTTTEEPDAYTNRERIAFTRITSYKNNDGAYRNRVAAPDYAEWITADNVGTHFAGAGDDGRITRGLFIGTSLNNLTPYPSVDTPPSAFATYHSTFMMRDNTLVNFPFVEGKSSGAFKADDYYLIPLEKGRILNVNNKLINTHPGFRNLPPHLQANQKPNEHWTFSGGLWDPHGDVGPAGNYWVFDVPFLTYGATCQMVQPAGKNGQSCAGEYYGVYVNKTSFDQKPYLFSAPYDVTRIDCAGTGTVGKANEQCKWVIGDGELSWAFSNMRHFTARPQAQYVLKFPGKPLPTMISFDVTNSYRATDSFMLAISFDGTRTPRGLVAQGLNAENNLNNTTTSQSSIRRFSAAGSYAEVAASNGEKFWQDSANNLVWVKINGGLTVPTQYPPTPNLDAPLPTGLYNPMNVYLVAQ